MINKFDSMFHVEKNCNCDLCYDKKIYELKRKLKEFNINNVSNHDNTNKNVNKTNLKKNKKCIHFFFN